MQVIYQVQILINTFAQFIVFPLIFFIILRSTLVYFKVSNAIYNAYNTHTHIYVFR